MASDDGRDPGLTMPEGAPPHAGLGVPESVRPTPPSGLAMPGTTAAAPAIEDDWDLESNLAALQEWIAWATRGRPLHEGGHVRLLDLNLTPDPALAQHRYERLRLQLDSWRSGGDDTALWAEQALEQDGALTELDELLASPDLWTARVESVRAARTGELQRTLEKKWSPYWKPPIGDMEIDPGEWRAITLDAQTTEDGFFGLYVAPQFLDAYRERLGKEGVKFSGTEFKMPWGDSILGVEDLPRSMKANEAAIAGGQFIQAMYQLGGTLRALPGDLAARLADAAIEVAQSGEDPTIGFWRVLWRGGDKALRLAPGSSVYSIEQLRSTADGSAERIEAVLRSGLLEAWLTDAIADDDLAEHAPKGGGVDPKATAEQFLWRIGEKSLLAGKGTYSSPKQLQVALETAGPERVKGIKRALKEGRVSTWLQAAHDELELSEKVETVRHERAARAPAEDRLLWAMGSLVFRIGTKKPTSPAELVEVVAGEPAKILKDLKSGRLGAWLDRALSNKDLARHAAGGSDVTIRHAEDLLWRLGEKRLVLGKKLKPDTVRGLEQLLLDRKNREAFQTPFKSGRVAAWLRIAQADNDAARRADPSTSTFPDDVDAGWIWFWRQGLKEFKLDALSLSQPAEILLLASTMKKLVPVCAAPAFAHWLREAHEMGPWADLLDKHRAAGQVEHGTLLLLWGLGHASLPIGSRSLSNGQQLLEALDRRDPELVAVLEDTKLAAWLSIRLEVELPEMPPAADPWLRLSAIGWSLGATSCWLGAVQTESPADFIARLDMGAFEDDVVRELVDGGFLPLWLGADAAVVGDIAGVAQRWGQRSHPQEHLARALGRAKPALKASKKKVELGRIREEVQFPVKLTLRNESVVGTGFVRFRTDSSVFTFPDSFALGPGEKRRIEVKYEAALGTTARNVKEQFDVVLNGRTVTVTVTGEGGVHPVQFLQAAGIGAAVTAVGVAVSRWLIGLSVGDYLYPPDAAGGPPMPGTEGAVLVGGWGLAVVTVVATLLLWRFGPASGERRRVPTETGPAWAVVPLVCLALIFGTVLLSTSGIRHDLSEAEAAEKQLKEAAAADAQARDTAEVKMIEGMDALLDSNWAEALSTLGGVVTGPGLTGDLKSLAQVACREAGEGSVLRPLDKSMFLVALENASQVPAECGGAEIVDRTASLYLDRLLAGGLVRGLGTAESRNLAYSALLHQLLVRNGNQWPQDQRRRRLAAQLIWQTGGKFRVGANHRKSFKEGMIFKDHFQVAMTVETMEWFPTRGLTLTVLVSVTGDKESLPAKCSPKLWVGGRQVSPDKVSGCSGEFGSNSRFTAVYDLGRLDLLNRMSYDSQYKDFPAIPFSAGDYIGAVGFTPDEPPLALR